MPHIEAAARVSVSGLMSSISTLGVRVLPARDRFIDVMEPFILKERVTIDAVSKLGSALDADLKNLLVYYGETPDSPDSPKPEDFFALILTFSSSLQKAALEVHDTEEKVQTPTALIVTSPETEQPIPELTLKVSHDVQMLAPPSSQGRATGTMKTIEHGALDLTIRSMRDGKRRARPERRPLSKMFIDGARG
ncbi:hypothetical protein EDB83DRAFT_1666008 [Lactarius deliciosus]|nr:hypothetical protein EDB83DRAFT_1666008 [Lactarius deliciosus]